MPLPSQVASVWPFTAGWSVRTWLALFTLALSSGCGRTAPYEYDVASARPPPSVPCTSGAIHGRICSTDGKTWVNGASASVEALDCHGAAVIRTAISAADGSFTLDDVPTGTWPVNATLGQFAQRALVTVLANRTTELTAKGLCLAQQDLKIAVVTGNGDKIERLLTDLKLKFVRFDGTPSGWARNGAVFLADLEKMKGFDLIFIDCAAGSSGYQVDLGPNASLIEANLRAYVLGGGSLYASDWGVVFADFASPGTLDLLTDVPAPVQSPFDCKHLMGFAPQEVTAAIADPGLRTFLGKDTVAIKFPKEGSAITLHWGLLRATHGASVLVQADHVATCNDATCDAQGPPRDGVPLAVRLKVTPEGTRGGFVVYTSFHNVAQTGDEVAQMLKYLVLNL